MTRVDRALLFVFILLIATLAPHSEAHAQSPEAEVLFRDGRKLIKIGKLEAGCDKIEASEKLESSVGTLLNLGDCREKLGRIASAWAAFRKAEGLAKQRGDQQRRTEASQRANALEHKLPQLAIMITSKIDGLVVKRDDEVVNPVLWNTSVPVDPDTYTIIAEAPGYKPWRTEVTINGKLKRNVVNIPSLERAPVAETKPPEKLAPTELSIDKPAGSSAYAAGKSAVVIAPPPTVVAPRVTRVESRSRWTTMRKVSVGVGVAGLAAAGTGIYFGLRAKDLQEQSDKICPGKICDDPEGLRLNDRAQSAARNANIFYALGGVGVATSVVLWFVGAPSKETIVTPTVGRDHAGVSFAGKF